MRGAAYLAEDLASAVHPPSSSGLAVRLQSSVLGEGRDQLQALLHLPEPKDAGLDRLQPSSASATLTKVRSMAPQGRLCTLPLPANVGVC